MKTPGRTKNQQQSLIFYALRLAIPIGVIVLLATWYVENNILESTIETELREHIVDIEARERKHLENNLNGIKDFAISLSANDLIINSLIDLEGRSAYIPLFFNSLVAPLSRLARVSLVDYQGRIIASNIGNNSISSMSASMVEKGAFFIDTDKLLVVEPILISGFAEGAIVLYYPRTAYEELFGNLSFPHSIYVIGDNDLVVYSTNSDLATTGDYYTNPTLDGWLQIHSTIPESSIQVTIGSSLEVALESMEAVQLVRIAGLVALLIVSIGLVLLSAFIVSRPLMQISTGISKIKSIGDLNRPLDTKGPREIAEIATTFNRMADWLQSTAVSRNYMDNIFGSITEGIVTIDSKGLITTFNNSATRLFGYDDKEVIGKNVSVLMHDNEREDHDEYLAKADLHETRIIAQNRDLQGRRKDGSMFSLELIVTPLEEGGLNGYVGTIRDITARKLIEQNLEHQTQELKRINNELEYMALNDSLTGLGNRNLFTDRLSNLIATCRRNKAPFSLLMMDLNKFKQVNDTHGHEAGDEVLRQVGKRFIALGRDADMFFRLGGDEFAALITTGVTHEGISIMAGRIKDIIEVPMEFNSLKFNIGISIGIVLFPEHSEDEEELLRMSDLAMYDAKRGQLGHLIAPAPNSSP